jgi:carbon-monoxide dehydrogenase medium subunit
MKPAPFTYYKPTSRAETLALLTEYGDDGKVLAGGQSLVAAMNFRLARPSVLIDLNGVEDLDYLRASDGKLLIGALTRHASFHKPVVEGPLGKLLSHVVHHIAHYPIRQRGTFAGSLSHADPASEWCLTATTLDAEMVIQNGKDTRIVRAQDFFKGTFTTVLGPQDLLVEIRLPVLGPSWRAGFGEFSRRAGDFALAMSLCALEIEGRTIRTAQIGVGGVAERALRLPEVERRLIGKEAVESTFTAAAETARDVVTPTSDIHGTSKYRSDLMVVMIRRALQQAVA